MKTLSMDKKYPAHPKKQHSLAKVWNSYPDFFQNNNAGILLAPSIERIIGEIFARGQFYYCRIKFAASTLCSHHENILSMHGFHKYPTHLKEVIHLIHPDDLEFVM